MLLFLLCESLVVILKPSFVVLCLLILRIKCPPPPPKKSSSSTDGSVFVCLCFMIILPLLLLSVLFLLDLLHVFSFSLLLVRLSIRLPVSPLIKAIWRARGETVTFTFPVVLLVFRLLLFLVSVGWFLVVVLFLLLVMFWLFLFFALHSTMVCSFGSAGTLSQVLKVSVSCGWGFVWWFWLCLQV